MAKKFYGSICLSDLLSAAKIPHSAFTRGKNGKAYANIDVWINDQPDDFGNVMSIQLRSSKEKYKTEGKVYFGRLKLSDKPAGVKQKPKSNNGQWQQVVEDDGLPF